MTATTKAQALISAFTPFACSPQDAKSCALIAVAEAMKAIKSITGSALMKSDIEIINYWKSVKAEIKKQ